MEIVYVGLSTFAIVYLVKYTDGPFDVFARFRRHIGLDIPDYSPITEIGAAYYIEDDEPTGFFALLVKCFWCFSTWVALSLSLAYILLIGSQWQLFPFLWFSSITVSGCLHVVVAALEKYGESD
jgi:hypothetical protein